MVRQLGCVKNDLVVLVADADMEASMKGLIRRSEALGIRPVEPDIFRHSGRDPGVLKDAHNFLAAYSRSYEYALAMFDREGCGEESKTRSDLEVEVQARLEAHGWRGRCAVVAIDPELEVWVWADSPHVAEVLGLSQNDLSAVLCKHQPTAASGKPIRPKEAMNEALRLGRTPRSSALFRQLAERVSLQRCKVSSFLRLRRILRGWFRETGKATACDQPRVPT